MRVKHFCIGIHIHTEPVHFLSLLESLEGVGDKIFNLFGSLYFFLFQREFFHIDSVFQFMSDDRIFFLLLDFFFARHRFYLLQNIVFDVSFPLVVEFLFVSRRFFKFWF